MRAALLVPGLLLLGALEAAAEEVVTLTTAAFDQTLKDNKHALVEFYAPWCGHCKKLAPEYEKAAVTLKSSGVKLYKVDATEEKDLASRYGIKGFPTMVWFQDGKNMDYDGGRTADTIVDWVQSMTGPALLTEASVAAIKPPLDRPVLVLSADSPNPAFEEVAQKFRRKAAWYFVKASGSPKVSLIHKGEEPIDLTVGIDKEEKVTAFLMDNLLPLFGKLDGDTFDKYMEAGKGLVWSLFPNPEQGFDAIEAQYRPVMSEVASKFRGKYFVTFTDTEKFKEAIDNMLSIAEFPAIAVQKKAGDKRKFVYTGEMTAQKISAFIDDVESGRVEPRLKSEAVPTPSDDLIKTVVGTTMQKDVFTPDRDVLLEVYAPWCGHCKKLEPEYIKLAKKIKKEELTDLVTIAKMDGTANDSPVDSIEWTGFPTILYVKAGTTEAIVYDGERTAKGLWKYIKKTSSKAQEIRDRMERRKGASKRGDEL
uniref:Protein disulfide-isomerase n=1 Tax=Alexandrium monilatum TaxID=311494 RepID=A0A7S4T6H8_9DINO|mmetsp:Transcript_95088/g.301726  ORF Transcript_95088/g.301726 Transcript_95088/m.301726 type:complete len:479 (-) Transcript_95088:34-1470(-)